MFVDEISLHLKAGRGGDGVVRWLHEKRKEFGGPSGGNGGRGGDVYAVAVRDIGVLSSYRNVKEFAAGRGEDGSRNSRQGGVGKDIEIRLPVGSRVTNLSSGFSLELMHDEEKVVLLRGGRGGLGNHHFKSSTNIRPRESTFGEDGEEADFLIELMMIADIGIVGLPNAGKSSLLNALTKARSKIGHFPFTTLEPYLGDLSGLIIADIPGLIEGAADGKGLGHKFLRHVERTKALIHAISSELEDPLGAYRIVRNELGLYNESMLTKPETIVLTKLDMVTEEELVKKIELLRATGREVLTVSVLDDGAVKNLSDFLSKTYK